MSITIAHSPHVQIPWPQIAVIVAVVAAAVLFVAPAVDGSAAMSQKPAAFRAADAAAPAVTLDVPKNRSLAVRALRSGEAAASAAQAPASSLKSAQVLWAHGEGR